MSQDITENTEVKEEGKFNAKLDLSLKDFRHKIRKMVQVANPDQTITVKLVAAVKFDTVDAQIVLEV